MSRLLLHEHYVETQNTSSRLLQLDLQSSFTYLGLEVAVAHTLLVHVADCERGLGEDPVAHHGSGGKTRNELDEGATSTKESVYLRAHFSSRTVCEGLSSWL